MEKCYFHMSDRQAGDNFKNSMFFSEFIFLIFMKLN